jgi:hypothetical protein
MVTVGGWFMEKYFAIWLPCALVWFAAVVMKKLRSAGRPGEYEA